MHSQFLKAILSFSLTLGLFVGATSFVTQQALANTTITVEKAKEIALNHAKITDKNIFFSKTNLDTDDGRTEYEIEFFYNNYEYDFEIDAMSGKVTKSGKEKIKTSSKNVDMTKYINDAKAKEVALEHAKLSADKLSYSTVTFDIEDGQGIYDVDLYVGKTKYEYEIDATTCEVIKFEKEMK